MKNQLTIDTDTGEKKIVNVLDIIDAYAFNKTFVVYNFPEEPSKLYASILNESENTYSFETITNPDEIEYITAEVKRVANELINSKDKGGE